MTTVSAIRIAISSIAVLIYIFLVLGYELWLWKRGMEGGRKWLEKKLGYPIMVVTGWRFISWQIKDPAPAKTKICLMFMSNTFFLFAGMLPILLLAIVGLLMVWADIF